MKIYDYGKIKTCLICGSINGNVDRFVKMIVGSLSDIRKYKVEQHPKEIERQERIRKKQEEEAQALADGRNPFGIGGDIPHPHHPHGNDLRRCAKKISKQPKYCGYCLDGTVLIVNGSNTFGQNDLKYYYDKFNMLNDVLADNNTHILFVRGNDDPKYFTDELLNLSNVKTVQDYSVIKLNKFNCLCIGGQVSLDRLWKSEQEKRIGKKMFWENEHITFDEDAINEILSEYKISCIVTPSSPSFAYPGTNVFKKSPWVTKDKTLLNDLNDERVIMDRIYNKIIEGKSKPYIWAYSRFDSSNQSVINDILFQSLCPFQFFNFNNTAADYFNIDFSKQLKENEFSSNGEMAKKSFNFSSRTMIDRDIFADPFADADDREELEEIEEDEPVEEGNGQEGMENADSIFEMANPNMEIAQDEIGNTDEMNRAPYLGDTIRYTYNIEAPTIDMNSISSDNIAAPTVDMNMANAETYERLRERIDVALAQLTTNVGGENGTNQ